MSESTTEIRSAIDTGTASGAIRLPGHACQSVSRTTIAMALLSIIIATVAAYWPVLFNFFAGDDFVHLTWLADAMKNPELIWRNFHSSWLDGTTTGFYRPLISIFMVSDYLIWGTNGLGFHITNLSFHLASTIFLFFIVRAVACELRPGNMNQAAGSDAIASTRQQSIWALAAAALFSLYPLHPEAVSWITGRVDTMVTTFTLSSLWCFICWHQLRRRLWLAASLVSMALALMSKEMAVTAPALLFAWELFACQQGKVTIVQRVKAAIHSTFFFWLLLAAYFVLRRFALGTFVGGYDNSLTFIANWQLFLGGWAHGLRMLFVPVNGEILGSHHWLTKLWEISVACSIILTGWALVRQRKLALPFAFLFLWLILCLIPVYKIFAITDDLQGSRLAYLATAPLCALITFSLAAMSIPLKLAIPANTWERRSLRFLSPGSRQFRLPAVFRCPQVCVSVVLIACAGMLLWKNNQAWSAAGHESNSIRAQLDSLYKSLPGDPQVLFLGLPDNINGAYVTRNALMGMTRYPQMSRTASNCLPAGDVEPILPFGYLKESLAICKDKVKIFHWESSAKRFYPVLIPEPGKTTATNRWDGLELGNVLVPELRTGTRFHWLKDGSLESIGGPGVNGRPAIHIDLKKRPCWLVDFLVVHLSVVTPARTETARLTGTGVDLLYCNDLQPQANLRRRINLPLPAADGDLYFALRGMPAWALGGKCGDMQLLLPPSTDVTVKSIELAAPAQIMPQVKFPHSGYLGSKGFIHLSLTSPFQTIEVDGRKVPGASRIELEITRANLTFETQNARTPGSVVMKRLECDTACGAIQLRRTDFPAAGIYEARPRALDSRGNPLGVAGDHIVISIDS